MPEIEFVNHSPIEVFEAALANIEEGISKDVVRKSAHIPVRFTPLYGHKDFLKAFSAITMEAANQDSEIVWKKLSGFTRISISAIPQLKKTCCGLLLTLANQFSNPADKTFDLLEVMSLAKDELLFVDRKERGQFNSKITKGIKSGIDNFIAEQSDPDINKFNERLKFYEGKIPEKVLEFIRKRMDSRYNEKMRGLKQMTKGASAT